MATRLLLLFFWVIGYQVLKYADPAWDCGEAQARLLFPVGAAVILLFVYFGFRREEWHRLRAVCPAGIDWRDVLRFEGLGFVIGVAVVVPPLCLLLLGFWPEVASAWGAQIEARLPIEKWQSCPPLFARDFIYMVIVAPFLEELLYRFVISRELERAMPGWVAGGLASVAFGIAHLSVFETGLNLDKLIVYTLMGVYFQWIYRYSGLLAAISVHAGINLTAGLLVLGLVWG
jgi:membrane protease YdiL (CAAX protease family)